MKNIVLVGFMGTGKTTVGRLLADKLSMPLIDMDREIERQTQKTIPQIFSDEGEPYFRSLERSLVQKLTAQQGQIISTGGGIVLQPKNIADFEKTGLVCCLHAQAEQLLKRLAKDSSRPLLSGDKAEQIKTLLAERDDLYHAIEWGIQTDDKQPEEIAELIYTEYLSQS
jgi:shikimate kinase